MRDLTVPKNIEQLLEKIAEENGLSFLKILNLMPNAVSFNIAAIVNIYGENTPIEERNMLHEGGSVPLFCIPSNISEADLRNLISEKL
ncbi:MAG: hypothetical protein OXQ96_08285 [Alphaproteobacteria bacterium]|nr:hypothetical protein [Alphaproteobacteria bacterium]